MGIKYSNTDVRRQDRLLDETRALALLREGEYGILSMSDSHNHPYGIPVSYVWDGADTIYIHCAPEGRKLRVIAENPEVSFCIVGKTRVIPARFTTAYESVVLSCRANTGLDDEERMNALRLLIEKYSPDFREIGEKYAKGSFHRTEVIALHISSFSGKAKIVKQES